MMREHPNDLGFLIAGANAAETAKRFLHPELEGQHGGPTVLPSLMAPAIPSAIEWVTQEENERLAAEARARATATRVAAEILTSERVERAEHTAKMTRQIGLVVFVIYLGLNLLFGIRELIYWIDTAQKSVNFATNFSICLVEVFRCLANSSTTAVVLLMLWRSHPRALDTAIACLLVRVFIALSVAAYYESLRRIPLSYIETWQPSAIAAGFWVPCLLSFREHWKSWSALRISQSAPAQDVVSAPVSTSAKPPLSWQIVTLLSVAMICGTAFAIACLYFRR